MMFRTITSLLLLIPLLSYSQLDPDLESIFNTALQSQVDNGDYGVSAVVILPDETLWVSGAGVDFEGEPINHITVFWGGSNTQTHIATVIYQMYEAGLFDLEDPIFDYLENMDNVDPNTTIQQLLNHTSGIFDVTQHAAFYSTALENTEKIYEPEEILSLFLDQSPAFEAGSKFGFSHTNYILLGLLIENISGQPIEEYIKFRIWDQVPLNNTFYGGAEQFSNSFAGLWADFEDQGQLTDYNDISYNSLLSLNWSTGNIVSAPLDAARFIRMLFSGDLIEQATLEEMMVIDGSLFPPLSTQTFGSGLTKLRGDRDELFGSSGNLGNTSHMYHSPEHNYTISVMSNTQSNSMEAFNSIQTGLINFLNPISDVPELSVKEITSYPNPCLDYLFVDTPVISSTKTNIYNMNGQRFKTEIDGGSINVSHLIPGMYFLEIIYEDYIYNSKFIKQ